LISYTTIHQSLNAYQLLAPSNRTANDAQLYLEHLLLQYL
jgi:hypothetical protein